MRMTLLLKKNYRLNLNSMRMPLLEKKIEKTVPSDSKKNHVRSLTSVAKRIAVELFLPQAKKRKRRA
jgi:hypothetical protein